jgi:hypothetical protein
MAKEPTLFIIFSNFDSRDVHGSLCKTMRLDESYRLVTNVLVLNSHCSRFAVFTNTTRQRSVFNRDGHLCLIDRRKCSGGNSSLLNLWNFLIQFSHIRIYYYLWPNFSETSKACTKIEKWCLETNHWQFICLMISREGRAIDTNGFRILFVILNTINSQKIVESWGHLSRKKVFEKT